MATTSNHDHSTLKKVIKKVTTPSSSHPYTSSTHRRQTSSRSASLSDKDDSGDTPSAKPIPNYLKPTFSSRSETFKHVIKKSTTGHEDHTTQKRAALLRRRSFDRPPSSIHHVTKSSDHKERPGLRDRIMPVVRSSSFSSGNVSSPRSTVSVDRNAATSTHKHGKSQPIAMRNTRRSMSPASTKKVANARSASPKERISRDVTQSLEPEMKQDNGGESFVVHETEETLSAIASSDGSVPSDHPVNAKNKETVHIDVAAESTDVNNGEREKVPKSSYNIPTDVEEESTVSVLAKPNEIDAELQQESTENQHEGDQENNDVKLEGSINTNLEDGIAADEAKLDQADDHVKVEENSDENSVSPEVPVGEEKKPDEDMNVKQHLNEGSNELIKSQEEQYHDQTDDNAAAHEKANQDHAANAVPQKKQVVVQGNKKEAHTAYNDVIEETKNKLLEERKNKVKALVGAFETVIDYESAGSK